ncbi:MAG TPA: hypothetical protein VEH27_05335 [Methylomirabilota bacterium]|nr:hypothetical protein [Methylomirabilota bacterium]
MPQQRQRPRTVLGDYDQSKYAPSVSDFLLNAGEAGRQALRENYEKAKAAFLEIA